MELQEEVMGTNDHSHTVKGKRTKRQRLLLSAAPGGFSSSSSIGDDQNLQSPTSSTEFSASTDEEDMANCLILLAQGRIREGAGIQLRAEEGGGEKFTSRRFTETATTTTGKAGFYVYECKTCNRSFSSFQALGGHRASHKKPKVEEENNQQISTSLQVGKPIANYNNIGNNNNNKSRVHECSICGSEFSSGQALGGHMRRHRTANMAEGQEPSKNKKNIISLDLNLPAPEDDRDYSKSQSGFTFPRRQPLVFAGSPLVDCHY